MKEVQRFLSNLTYQGREFSNVIRSGDCLLFILNIDNIDNFKYIFDVETTQILDYNIWFM